ncbi:hypothetical protein [Lewinella sp. IMCC34191]|uniref:hypothetical protein n=1 Tax=Lewinella sp. IMCC34191 TaxID=2259172 RepID=UPI000E27DAA9|nr:hypothetical protein [Lewinella sp. IMCC34191]
MAPNKLSIEDLNGKEKMQLLEKLLNDLHEEGILGSHSLMAIASDVMYLDYQEDEDLLHFTAFTPENEEE